MKVFVHLDSFCGFARLFAFCSCLPIQLTSPVQQGNRVQSQMANLVLQAGLAKGLGHVAPYDLQELTKLEAGGSRVDTHFVAHRVFFSWGGEVAFLVCTDLAFVQSHVSHNMWNQPLSSHKSFQP